MFIKDDYKIKIIQADGIELKGYYCEKDKNRCVVCFAGLGGNCDRMFSAIADKAITNNLRFLFANTQASYIVRRTSNAKIAPTKFKFKIWNNPQCNPFF